MTVEIDEMTVAGQGMAVTLESSTTIIQHKLKILFGG